MHETAWREAHETCLRLARRSAALDRELGRAALAARRAGVDRRLGLGSFVEYAERTFGWAPRTTREHLRVAEELEHLPEIDAALADGELSFSAAREITRVATRETETAWRVAALGRTVRELEALVGGRSPGDLPGDPARPGAERHVLHLEVDAATYALYRQAVVALREAQGGDLDEAAALALMARAALGGPGDDGRATHQIMIRECPSCGEACQEGGGRVVVISDEAGERARCDAQVIDLADVDNGAAGAAHARQDVPPAVRRAVLRRDGRACRVPGCRAASFLDVHHIVPRADGGGHEPDNLITLCGRHHDVVHEGRLVVEIDRAGAEAGGAPRFRHADGTPYGQPPRPDLVDAVAGAFCELRARGWSEREARHALDDQLAHDYEVARASSANQSLRRART